MLPIGSVGIVIDAGLVILSLFQTQRIRYKLFATKSSAGLYIKTSAAKDPARPGYTTACPQTLFPSKNTDCSEARRAFMFRAHFSKEKIEFLLYLGTGATRYGGVGVLIDPPARPAG
jgi:hypothetical protein